MRTFSLYVRMQTLYCKVIFVLLSTLKLLMSLSLQKTDLTRFFINKLRHTGRLKKQIRVEKTLSGSPGHIRQNAYYRNLKRTFEDLLPCYCYAIKTKSTTIR